MKKRAHFITEFVLGFLITGLITWSYFTRSTVVETASLKTYDFLSQFQAHSGNSNVIKIVEIDEESVANLGRWPWPRSLTAALIDELADYGAQVIGANILFVEADQNEGFEEVTRLYDAFDEIMRQNRRKLRLKKANIEPFEEFLLDLERTQLDLDGDAILARSLDEAGNIVLPMYFVPGDPGGENLEPLPDYLDEHTAHLNPGMEDHAFITTTLQAATPLEDFGETALAVGHVNLLPDQDGVIRKLSPTLDYGNRLYPSFGLQLVREYKNLPVDALSLNDPHTFALRSFNIPVDDDGQAFIKFAGPAGTFDRYSAIDVLSRGVPDDALNNKIVLFGTTAPGLGQNFVVPSGETFNELELWANHINNILTQDFIGRPEWAVMAEWGTIALAAIIVLFILPLIRAKFAVPLALVAFVGIAGASGFFFIKQGLWVTPAYGCVLLATGFVVLVGRRLIFTEKGKEIVEAEGLETNKMLGLSFQGQGMLDLAFEKFRKVPIDNQLKDLLYNLGLDMERKRMFAKAAAVYEHIATVDAKYKDIKNKIELLKKAGEGAVFGGVGKKGSDATVVVEGLGQATTLGRYEVIKELGRGAMGIVYLGKDPKINRQVAIKTLRFEDDVSEEQARSIKERFFREAESAGNLTHPNIIRIFDAGEDQDVAYIAMELIEGHDLKENCDKGKLLPILTTLEYMANVADALDYAHKQGVVHRDIKPPNLMLLKDGTLRITDFGIARIQATSKTATGAVLGTPAYMSPEQVNGKKVDGRADIFSLGVTLYELLVGEKPFAADSIAALLYRIANVDHPDPREFNPDVPECVINVINKAMQKDPTKRYQKAEEMAQELKDCIRSIKDGSAGSPAEHPAQPEPPSEVVAEAKHDPAPDPINIVEPESEEIPPPEKKEPPQEFIKDLKSALESPAENKPAFETPAEKPTSPENNPVSTQAEPINPPQDDKTVVMAPEAGGDLADFFFGDQEKKPGEAESTAVTEDKDKTVVLPEDTDKTVALETGFEHNFQPPTPSDEMDGDQEKTS